MIEVRLGRTEAARADAAEAMRTADPRDVAVAITSAAMGLLELSSGRPHQAHAAMAALAEDIRTRGLTDPGLPQYWFVSDEIEALIELGDVEAADGYLRRLERRANRVRRHSALARAARCRALVAARGRDPSVAIPHLVTALGHHDRATDPFERSRTLLVLGQVQRRLKRWGEARHSITTARQVIDELGAELWSERATSELERIGGRHAAAALSVVERRIADLVAHGNSNKEIAWALSISVRTVEWNLTNIYRKQHVRSRTGLVRSVTAATCPLCSGRDVLEVTSP
jgi:DNA-binding CsgD family transcriptional regulator